MKYRFPIPTSNCVLLRTHTGFTVLEVVVAIFIFGVISAALMKLLGTADRIHGRANYVMETVNIAQSEAERIRNTAAFKEVPADCTYTITVNDRDFDVQRLILQDDFADPNSNDRLKEIEIRINALNSTDTTKFRFIQGFTW